MAKKILDNSTTAIPVTFGEQRGKINDNFTELYDGKLDKETGKSLVDNDEISRLASVTNQPVLIAGDNISIDPETKVISATASGGSGSLWTEVGSYEAFGSLVIRKIIGYYGGIGAVPAELSANIGKYNAKIGGFTTVKADATTWTSGSAVLKNTIAPSYGYDLNNSIVKINTVAKTITFPIYFIVLGNEAGGFVSNQSVTEQVVSLIPTKIDGTPTVFSNIGYVVMEVSTKKIRVVYFTEYSNSPSNTHILFGILNLNISAVGDNITNVFVKAFFDYRINGLSPSAGIDNNLQKNIIPPIAASYTNGEVTNTFSGLPVTQRFNFLHVTDLHYDSQNADTNYIEALGVLKNPLLIGRFDAVVASGDFCNGTRSRLKATAVAELTSFKNTSLTSTVPVITCMGNHDDNIDMHNGLANVPTELLNAISKTELYNLLVKPFVDKWSKTTSVLNKLYSHTDFSSKKMRVISLDFTDTPIVDNGAGKFKYITNYYYGQEQLNWLEATLQSTPADYAIIVVTHNPPNALYSFVPTAQPLSLIPDIINAWKNGTTFNHSYTDTKYAGDLSTSKIFDFTARGTGEFVTYVCGHVHTLAFPKAENHPDQNIIIGANLWTKGNSTIFFMRRENEEELRNSFNLISIDRFDKQIFVTTFGAHKTANGKIRERINVLNY